MTVYLVKITFKTITIFIEHQMPQIRQFHSTLKWTHLHKKMFTLFFN